MTRIRHHDRVVGFRIVSQMMVFLIVTCVAVCACTTTRRHVSGKDKKNIYLEKELAEANQRIEELYHRISVLQFMVDSHEKAIKDMENPSSGKKRTTVYSSSKPRRSLDASSSMGPSLSDESPENLYNQARKVYNDKQYKKAATLFSTLAKTYPHHDLADNAIYWQGESLYAQKNFSGAIHYFKEMMNAYPDSNKTPDAMLKTGFAFLSTGDKKNAKLYLKKVTRLFPFSGAASKAAETLKTINK